MRRVNCRETVAVPLSMSVSRLSRRDVHSLSLTITLAVAVVAAACWPIVHDGHHQQRRAACSPPPDTSLGNAFAFAPCMRDCCRCLQS